MTRKILLITCALALLSISVANARPNKTWKSWFGHVEGGFILGQGDYGNIVDDDFSISGGATYYPSNWPFGLDFTLSWSDQDFDSSVLRAINDQIEPGMGTITGGGVEIWSLVPGVVWHTRRNSGIGYSFSVGAGLYDITGTLTNDGLVYYPPVCDPWFWWCVPGGVGPGTVVRAKESTTEFGWNVGLGVFLPLSSGSEVFFEAKYQKVETDLISTEYIPINVGIRW